MKFLQKNNNGFTLAEVLITLVIVGVIASMTIPTLMNNTNNQEYVARLKKAYSTLSQATNRIIADIGSPQASIGGWATSSENVYQIYKKYLSNAKECGNTSKCFTQLNGQGYKLLNNSGYDGTWVESAGTRTLVLADGVQVTFLYYSPTCGYENWSQTNRCVEVAVDVNGAKGPNTWGRDAFRMAITPTGLYPYGCELDDCVNTAASGALCSCKVLCEGAINY